MQAKLMRRISVPQQSIVAPHDVAHASVRSRPEIWKVVRAAVRFGDVKNSPGLRTVFDAS
jgi:hypothetical protein